VNTQEAYEAQLAYFSLPGAKLAQGWTDGEPRCFYRHPEDGRACAVGCLLSDDVVTQDLIDRNPGADNLFDGDYPEVESVLCDIDTDWLEQTQRLHDDAASVGEFISKLHDLAETYDLEVRR
jgi:hypothetical protein